MDEEAAGLADISKKTPRGKGRPFQPGQSGNPGGRPKMTDEERDALSAIRSLAPLAAEKLEEILTAPDIGVSHRLRAIEIVLERSFGKPEARVKLLDASFNALDEAFAAMKGGAEDDTKK